MKKKALHILVTGLLLANLLFSQVVINLLHDPHNFHEPGILLKDGRYALQKHGEHCKVCSLDILFNLLPATATLVDPQSSEPGKAVLFYTRVALVPVSLSLGRAPPLS